MNTRRQFLIRAPLAVLVTAAGIKSVDSQTPTQTPATPGAPPTFGTAPGAGPEVTPATFAEAEKLMQVTMTGAEREQAASSWRSSMAAYLERRTGPRKLALDASIAPATQWNPRLPTAPRWTSSTGLSAPQPIRAHFRPVMPTSRSRPYRSYRAGSKAGSSRPSD